MADVRGDPGQEPRLRSPGHPQQATTLIPGQSTGHVSRHRQALSHMGVDARHPGTVGHGEVELHPPLEIEGELDSMDRVRNVSVLSAPDGREAVIEWTNFTDGRVTRGDEHDVLARYASAAREVGADIVMRVTSDCPFIDPAICGRVRDLLIASEADYACNNMPAKFPHGLDCEAFSAQRLYDAEWLARTLHEREHVTPWMRAREDLVKVCLAGPGSGLERFRWTLDHPEDLLFARAVYDQLGERAATAPWTEVAALCLRRPDIVAINAERADGARLKHAMRADLVTTPTPFALAA